jgi:hypothetical protein
MMFELLGEIPEEVTKDWHKNVKETKQYISLESIQKNLHKVFKVTNDYFAKVLFKFLSRRGHEATKINF